MATLVFSALGTALGGPLGGVLGALVGRQVDAAVFPAPGREGPRLRELAVTTSSYGDPIARHFGRVRAGGAVIWATDLSESRKTSGGGKGRPAVTTYSYSASFAVALASRPLAGVGRIWADGNLLRGAAGDLKVGGQFRFHAGYGDQPPDPLLAAAEAAGRCPAYRGTAYAVFEDLQLADFGNRIPALSFELLGGEDALDLAALAKFAVPELVASVPLPGIAGISVDGALTATLAALAPVIPFACDAAGGALTLAAPYPAPRPLGVATADSGGAEPGTTGFGSRTGYARSRTPPVEVPLGILRYYDLARDYQPGLQRAAGAQPSGEPRTHELPATLASGSALALIEAAAARENWSRQALTWRTAELDPAIAPGALVRAPGQPGVWRVADWEWREQGVELRLWRTPLADAGTAPPPPGADSGRAVLAADRANGVTVLHAFELPWDGSGSGPAATTWLAASSPAAGWSGAALFAEDSGGALTAIGSTGRTRCAMGRAVDALADGTSLLPDRSDSVEIELLADDQPLADATGAQLAQGANRALLGTELIQFARAEPLGAARWRLSGLLRGRGGTEQACAGHAAGERFVLLDDRLRAIDSALLGGAGMIAAIGLADPEPVRAPVALAGIATRPLSPVHPAAHWRDDGALDLTWTRRARGAWVWSDATEAPLHEESEAYDVLVGPEASPLAQWSVAVPQLTIAAADLAALPLAARGAPLLVRQRGSYGVSPAIALTVLP